MDAGDLPKRKETTIKTRRNFKIKICASLFSVLGGKPENDRKSLMYKWHRIGPTLTEIRAHISRTDLSVGPSLLRNLVLIYLSTAIGLTPGGSSTAHSYTQTVHRTTQ